MKHSQNSEKVCKDKLLNLLAEKAYRFGDFKLSSGRQSNHYINCKPVSLDGEGLNLICQVFAPFIAPDISSVAGLTLGADPLVSGMAMYASQNGNKVDGLIVRKEAKGHGTGAFIEGPIPPRDSKVIVLEDVVTTGNSSLKAVEKIRHAGLKVDIVLTLVDRQEGADEIMKEEKIDLISIFLLEDIIRKVSS